MLAVPRLFTAVPRLFTAVPRPHTPALPSMVLVLWAGLGALILAGCRSSEPSPTGPGYETPAPAAASAPAVPATPTGASEATPAAPPEAPSAETPPPASPTASPPGSPGSVPPAIEELKTKLQPRGPETKVAELDPVTLLAEAEVTVGKLVDSLARSDEKAGAAILYDAEAFKETVSPGFRDIIEGHLTSANQEVHRNLIESLRGKTVTHAWQPGTYSVAPAKSTFRDAVPTLTNSTIALTVDGVRIDVRVDQLVYTRSGWKVFRWSTP